MESCDLWSFFRCATSSTYRHKHEHKLSKSIPCGREQMWCDIRVQCFSYKWNNSSQVAGWYWVILTPEATSNCAITPLTGNEQHAVYESCPEPRLPNYWPKHGFHVCHWHSGFSYMLMSMLGSLNSACIFAFMCVLLGYVGQVAFWISDKPRLINIYFWAD